MIIQNFKRVSENWSINKRIEKSIQMQYEQYIIYRVKKE